MYNGCTISHSLVGDKMYVTPAMKRAGLRKHVATIPPNYSSSNREGINQKEKNT